MEEKDVYKELSSIRDLMERSTKFISLSGLSGVLAGIYALMGARFGFRAMENLEGLDPNRPDVKDAVVFLTLIALAVFILSFVTCYWLSMRKAKKRGENVWNPVSRRLLGAVAVPMITGGLFIAVLLLQQQYFAIASACLVFYGLALVVASQYTFNEVKWLGFGEILLGLLALNNPGYSVIFWAIGFGILHIIYGTFMHFKYER